MKIYLFESTSWRLPKNGVFGVFLGALTANKVVVCPYGWYFKSKSKCILVGKIPRQILLTIFVLKICSIWRELKFLKTGHLPKRNHINGYFVSRTIEHVAPF